MLHHQSVQSCARTPLRAVCTLLATVVLMAGFTPLAQRSAAAVQDPPARAFDVAAANAGLLGAEPNGPSEEAVVSDDGRFVVFTTHADNLFADQPASDAEQLVRRDLVTGEVELVSVTHDGQVSGAGGEAASVSADGRYVAFESFSRDLVPHSYPSGNHLFLRDMQRDTTVRVGERGLYPKISDDGSTLLYEHGATYPNSLVVLKAGDEDGVADDVLWETDAAGTVRGTTTTVPGTLDAWMWNHNLSGDGNVVAWHEGWWDRATREQTWRLKVRDMRSDAAAPNEDLGALVAPLNMNNPPDNMWPPALSEDGRHVGYHVIELTRDVVYVRDRTKAEPEMLVESSYADRIDYVELSDDARHVVYSVTEPGPRQLDGYDGWHWWNGEGLALPLRMDGMCYFDDYDGVATQLYRLDRETGLTQHVTATPDGGDATHSCAPDLSGDGTTVVFQSYAADLVAGATETDRYLDYDVFAAKLPDATAPPSWPAGSGLRAEEVSATTVRLSWDSAATHGTGLSGYVVYQGDDDVTDVAADEDRSALISGLTPSTTYTFGVEALDALGATSPRLTVEATTAPLVDPGTAPLLASVARGGTVTLSWDPFEGATGYRVMRARGTGDLTQVAELSGDEQGYTDAALPAATSYRYLVVAVVDGRATPHTVERAVEVGPVVADALTATVPRAGGSGTAVMGKDVALTLTGDPGRRAEVTVAFDDWLGEGDAERLAPAREQAVVQLTEQSAGVYSGTFPLRPGVAALDSVTGRLGDDHDNSSAPVTASGFPLVVSGALRVSVDAPADSLPGARLSAWSSTRRTGAARAVTGGGEVLLPVPAADDYVVRLQRSDGRDAARAEIPVRAGMVASQDLVATLPAELAVRLLGPDGAPMDAVVQVTGTTPSLSGAASATAPARLRALDAGTTVTITATHEQATTLLQRSVTVTKTLAPGLNEVDIAAVTLPHGTLTGRITGEDGPLPRDVRLVVTQRVDGLDRSFSTTTDAEGRYTLPVLAGPARVEVTGTGYRPETADLSVVADQSTTWDAELAVARNYSIGIRLLTKYLGTSDFVEQDLDWRVAVHFGLSVTTLDGQWIGRAQNPTTVVGAPGEQVNVCASGREAGLPDDCETVTLPDVAPGETGSAAVELRLAEVGALRTSLLDASGAAYDGFWQGSLLRAEPDGSRTHVRALSGTVAPRLAVPSAGPYVIELTGGGHRWRSPVVQVPEGQEVVVDALRASAGGPFSGAGNSVDVTRTTALPDAAVEVRTAFTSSATAPLTDAVARLEVPGGTSLVEGSLLRDGQPVDGVVRDGFVEVPLGTLAPGASGVLRHQVRLDAVEPGSTVTFSSSLRTSPSGGDGELVGSAQVVVAGVTLSAPRRVPSTDVPVSGRAPAGASVGVYSEGVLLGRAQATPGGFWSTRVTLPDLGDLHTHVLSATADNGSRTLRSETEPVTVDADHLVATQISVQQTNGRRITFDPAQGVARFPYVYVPGNAMVVEASFAEPERVENVRVRIGTREAPATFVDGVFRATVDADGRGGIYVDYDVTGKAARVDEPPGGALTEAQVRERMPAPVRDFQLRGAPTYSSDGEVDRGSFTLDLPSLDSSLTGTLEVEQDQTYTVTPQDAESERRSGSPFYGLEITERRQGDQVVVELSGHVPQDQLGDDGTGALEAAVGFLTRALGADDEKTLGASSAAAGASVETARIGFQIAFNYVTNGDSLYQAVTAGGKYEEIERMYAALDSSGCDHEVKEGYRALADSAATRAIVVDVLNIGITALGYVLAPATFGMGTIALWGVGWVAGKAMDFALGAQIERSSHTIAAAVAFCRRKGREDLPLDDPRPKTADPVWIFDPSGYVYEAVPSNRLTGVTATVFQKDEDAGTWAAWDAEWFGQDNPQVTGGDGRYAWDVPAGLWQVVYEKEGYARTQSAELRVLPPHFDVNVGLISLAAPQVESVQAVAGGPVEIRFDRYMEPDTVTAAVTVGRGEDALTGELVAADAEQAPDGATYARTFRFTPSSPLVAGEVLRVRVDELAQNYAQRTLEADVERELTVAAAVTVPAAPQAVDATPGDRTVTVNWQPPATDGGSPVTGYTVTSDPATAPLTLPASATQARVDGLTNGTAYRFTVAAVNEVGTGPGTTSGTVTPRPGTSGGGGDGGQPTSPPTSPPPPLPSPSTPAPTAPPNDRPTAPPPTAPPTTPPTTPPTAPPVGSPSTGSSSDSPPSAQDPVVVRVTSPGGGAITFTPGPAQDPPGFVAAGPSWLIEAPDATVEEPLELVFRVDGSVLREGIPVGVFGDGTLVTGCTSTDAAEPDPCLLRATELDDGDVELVVLSARTSRWLLAQPEAGSLEGACTPEAADPFTDTRGSVHRRAIACLAGHGITTGTSPTTFTPAEQVTRAQMASFVARLLDRAGVDLPQGTDPGFADVPSGVPHATAIAQLAELGVVRGVTATQYRPGETVTRAQMASFLTRAYALTTDAALPTSAPFEDVAGDAHEQSIGTIAALGITSGVTPTHYVPGQPVSREQMASFLARTLTLLVVGGKVTV